MSFVHLRVHTEYSLSDSIISVDKLANIAAEYKMPAVGITERNNAFSAIKAYKTCRRIGVKPIIGAEVAIEDFDNPDTTSLLVLICQNMQGFQALCRILTRAHQRVKSGDAVCAKPGWLSESECQGLIALSGGLQGQLGKALLKNRNDVAMQVIKHYQSIFPERFYLEISKMSEDSEDVYNDAVLEFAEHTQTPLVATHQPRFIRRDEFEFHKLKVTIHDQQTGGVNNTNSKAYTPEQYFCPGEEMAQKFSDVPGAIENAIQIAKRCNLTLDLNRTTHMPAYRAEDKGFDINDHLRTVSFEGLEKRLEDAKEQRYVERLEHELEIISATNFAGYFLIVSDIIRWAKSQDISVGPGRGSGAGSLVAYCLDITAVDPIKHDLIFERFLTPDRVSPPDFDIDFCVWERDKVIEHVTERYGKDQVGQIITYQTMAARAAVKNVGRALRPDYLFYDQVAKLVPEELNITLKSALERSSELRSRYENEERIKELIDSAMVLEGMVLNVSKHPAGLVISPTEITDFTPLMADTESNRDTTHFDKDDLEDIGLVKFDFLGLKTLTIIALTLRTINAKRTSGEKFTEDSIPDDDTATYEYISSGRTAGIFQLESGGMQRLIHAIEPDKFEDLVALLALFRPGPLQNKMDRMYIENRNQKEYDVPHPDLKEVLDQSNGVILYQEQVMKIAQLMSGYTLAEADALRKAMGKKLKQEMQEQRERFVNGAVEKRYEKKLAQKVYDWIESFAGYGFNKSHSVAYAVLAYRTAYLKTHFRADFLAAFMSVDMDIKTIVKLCADAKAQGIEVLAPDINRSVHNFSALNDHQILYGLGALKRIGKLVVDNIEKSRESGGDFKDLMDFCLRIDLQVVSRVACEALISAGAFDQIDSDRGALLNQIASIYGIAQQHVEDAKLGQQSMFSDATEEILEIPRVNGKTWSRAQLLAKEYEILGLYLSGHPIELYADQLQSIGTFTRIAAIDKEATGSILVAGTVCNRSFSERRGETTAFFELEDASGQVSVAVYSKVLSTCRDFIQDNKLLIIVGGFESSKYSKSIRFQADRIFDFDTVRRSDAVRVILKLAADKLRPQALLKIKDVMTAQSGSRHKVFVEYTSAKGVFVPYKLNNGWRVTVTDELISRFREILGEESVCVDYSNVQLPEQFS